MKAMGSIPFLLFALAQEAQAHIPLHREIVTGRVLPLTEILRRLLPQMPGYRHIGSEYDPQARRYRVKFMGEGRVVWIDVDARSGHILGRASP